MKTLREEKNQLQRAAWYPITFVVIIWAIKIVEELMGLDFSHFGIYPRTLDGLQGLLTYPLIHGDAQQVEKGFQLFANFDHLLSNSLPLLVLGFFLVVSYPRVSWRVFLFIYFIPGLFIWCFGRPSYHIGASGVVYGLAFFIFWSGVFRREVKSLALAGIVAVFYGGMIWGVLPLYEGVSWEGHLAGAMAGTYMAWTYRHTDLHKPKYSWSDQPVQKELIEEPFWVKKPEPIEEILESADNNNPSTELERLGDSILEKTAPQHNQYSELFQEDNNEKLKETQANETDKPKPESKQEDDFFTKYKYIYIEKGKEHKSNDKNT